MAYEVSTPVFEGPFDLLLHLITKDQVNLSEIRLSSIVNGFLAEIERMQAVDLDVATEFLVIAATLVELKLRRLLPERQTTELDEEFGLLEERDLLLAKLLEYQTFRQAAAALRSMSAQASESFPRTNVVEERFSTLTPDLLASVTPVQLRDALVRALRRAMLPKFEPRVVLDHVTEVRMTVAEAVSELAGEMSRRGVAAFRDLVDSTAPADVIVRFLAVLELFKQGWVDLDQPGNFRVLTVVWRPDGPDLEPGSDADLPSQLLTGVRSVNDRQSRPGRLVTTARKGEGVDDDDPDAAEADQAIDRALALVRNLQNAGPVTAVDDYEG